MWRHSKCLDGGIGRRARLKIWLSQGSGGSIPPLGTNPVTKVTGFFNARQRRELAHESWRGLKNTTKCAAFC